MKVLRYLGLLIAVTLFYGGAASALVGMPPAITTYSGPVGITGSQNNGLDYLNKVCVNGSCPVTAFGASPEASSPLSISSSPNGTTVNLGSPGAFANANGIAIYGAGTACTINATDCGSITSPTPVVTWTGYSGSVEYDYKIAACDDGRGCAAVGGIGSILNGVNVLSEPKEGNQFISLSWTAVTGASHYIIWRQKAGAGYKLWAVVDTNSFTDYSNHQTMGVSGPYNNTPITAPQADVYVGTILSGAGSLVLKVSPSVPQTGTFSTFPDDTVAVQACWTAAGVVGGECKVPPGVLKVRTLTAVASVNFDGTKGTNNSSSKGSILAGTSGYDGIAFPSSSGNDSLSDIAIQGARNPIATTASTVTYVFLTNVSLSSEYASIEAPFNIEEWYGKHLTLQNGWYGLDQTGNAYIQKSDFSDVGVNGPVVNGIHIVTNTVVFSGNTFSRWFIQSIGQNAVYIGAPTSGITFDGYSDEGIGTDWARVQTTATCTGSNNIATVTSATGLNLGDVLSVVGCGANGDIWTGYICNIAGTAITIDSDGACTTAFNSSTAQATAQYATNSPYDNMYWDNGGAGSVTSVKLDAPLWANTGGCCGGTQTRFQANLPGMFGAITGGFGKVNSPAGNLTIGVGNSLTLYRDTIAGVGFQPGTISFPGTGGPIAQTFGLMVGPQGGDINIVLDDLSNTGLTALGCLNIRQYDTNRNAIFSACGSATSRDNAVIKYRGTLQSAGQTAPTLTAGCNGAGGAVTGSNNSFTVTTQSSGAATACTIHFAGGGFPSVPHCSCGDANGVTTGAIIPSVGTTTATDLIVDFTSSTSTKFNCNC